MESPLTRSIDLTGNKFVEASAGAGKTFALSKRYCNILDDFARRNIDSSSGEKYGVNNILVITFTRKAAAEMAGRIYTDLKILLDGDDLGEMKIHHPAFGKHLQNSPNDYKLWLRSAFPKNHISTIDSFCASVLRENAHLIDLDPLFILEDQALSQDYFDTTLKNFLDSKSRNFDIDLAIILNASNIWQLNHYFEYLHRRRHFLDSWLHRIVTLSEDEVKTEWLRLYVPPFDHEYILKSMSELSARLGMTQIDPSDQAYILLLNLKEKISALDPSASEIEMRYFIIRQLLPAFRIKNGNYRKNPPGNKNKWASPEVYARYKQNASDLLEYLNAELPAELLNKTPHENDFRAIRVLKSLAKLFMEFDDQLNNKKKQLNLLSFDDLIAKTRDLLSRFDTVRLKYHRQFKHILVDEFQDTNDQRWDIIRMIASDENGQLRKNGLFIVGDKKQSIYSFLKAEVEVMNHAEEALDNISEEPGSAVVKFNDNYRSSQEFIEYCINPIFSKIFPTAEDTPDLQPYEVPFSPAAYGRLPGKMEDERIRISSLTPDVCLIQGSCDDSDQAGPSVNDEFQPALHTACVAKKFLLWADETMISETPLIAILLRRFTKIQRYLRTFQRYNIPIEIVGGRNLYQQQETRDLFHLVSVLVNPLDDLAFVGLLRSPVFCIGDDKIHQLNENRDPGLPLFKAARQQEKFKPAADLIESWRELSKSLPLDRLLQQILSEDDREFSYFSEISGRQRLANIDRLIGLIHTLSLNGSSTGEIHDYLKYAIEAVKDMPQAEIPAAAKIQIMTIHQAKGLQFPAVIVPEMNTRPKADTSPIAHGSIDGKIPEVGLALLDEEGNSVKTGLLQAIMNQAKEKSSAEDARLLYVALTRAKYRAAILGDFKPNPRNVKSWWNRFVKSQDFCPDSFDQESWREHSLKYDKMKVSLVTVGELKEFLAGDERRETLPLTWITPPARKTGNEFLDLTPHHLMSMVFPEKQSSGNNRADTENGANLVFGSLFHHAMEKGWFEYSAHERDFKDYLDSSHPGTKKSLLLEKLSAQLQLLRGNELFQAIRTLDDDRKYPELPVYGWINNGKCFLQISGRMDLLYEDDGKWFCLDYKTDAGKDSLEKYKLQIRTYLWMLKQLYGIDAEGLIYYSDFGEIIRVPWDDKYYGQLCAVEPSAHFKPQIPASSVDSAALQSLLSILRNHADQPLIIVNQTKKQLLDTLTSVLNHTCIRPSVSLLTLRELLTGYQIEARKISPYLSRIIVEKLLTENYPGVSSRGLAEQLSAAVRDTDEWGGALIPEFENIRSLYQNEKSEKDLLSDKDVTERFLSEADFSGNTVVLNGFLGFKPSDFRIVRKLEKEAANFYFLDIMDGSLTKNSFEYDRTIWQNIAEASFPENDHSYDVSFSLDVEVEKTAQTILAIDNWRSKMDRIKIAVTSMEMYVPAVKRIFASYGIPATILKNEPVSERPVSQLVMSLLKIMGNPRGSEWKSISALLLHPLMEPGDEIFQLDKFCRLRGITDFSSLEYLRDSAAGHKLDDNLNAALRKATAFIGDFSVDSKAGHFNIAEKISEFIGKYKLSPRLKNNPVAFASLNKINEILEMIPHSYKIAGVKGDFESFKYDFKRLIGEKEVPTRHQPRGIEVLGTLDTFHLDPDYLFVMGMIEGNFPRTMPNNPLLKKPAPDLWYLDYALMKKWLSLKGEVHFSAPHRNTAGEPLQTSTFLEYLQKKTPDAENNRNIVMSPRKHYSRYYNTPIENPGADPRLQRHNQYLVPGNISPFRGKVRSSADTTLRISASGMDELLKCPMRYWFGRILKISPLDYNEDLEISLRLGTIVHDALCRFGAEGGFELSENNLSQACEKLNNVFENTFTAKGFNPADNLLLKKRYQYYLDSLLTAGENNLLVRLLNWNNDNFAGYQPAFFEQPFGMREKGEEVSWDETVIRGDGVTLSFNGKIDKVMLNDETGAVLATDYKTGNIAVKDISEFWSSQFPVYYFALKQQFPDKKIILAYEQIKSLRKNQHGVSPIFGEINFENAPMPSSGSHKYDILLSSGPDDHDDSKLSIETLKNTFLASARKVLEGQFHLAERELNGKACEYCGYEGICRKDCVRM